ncbi:hypothetical protein [Roseimicrobium sp. ORNL1]|uniref:hypothetical protein n=1 Tax=Roseimicrobium sp. ORNL1 TaxID=2711231 RepID=UPI0013E1F97C|nr:hypothetical protein [Roseimicrobium sp. ORNL1]QIF03119.1 hypothetical protein G5S37_16855 [Roseimicrobium sp. ORNL1]
MNLLQKITLVLFAGTPGLAFGCIWDSDTLASESARFPDIAGIMTGIFPRHSKEYHEWRVKQKKPLVDSGKGSAMDFDDLAVSQHKLGDHKAAIATMMAKEKQIPGKYETYSNLGTFCIYTGDLFDAVKWIEKALYINPNAHFGREKYQRWLVLWVLENKMNVKTDEEIAEERRRSWDGKPVGFAAFIARKQLGDLSPNSQTPLKFTETQRQTAIEGVKGMMYFADFDNPILQEALGDLLSFGNMDENAAQLAGLCYLHASEKTADPLEKARLKKLRGMVLSSSHEREEAESSKTLTYALEKGQKLNAAVRSEEMAWISAGQDATVEFQKKYLQAAR